MIAKIKQLADLIAEGLCGQDGAIFIKSETDPDEWFIRTNEECVQSGKGVKPAKGGKK